jgi:K+-sensing histidine kinase KdpD
MVINGNFLHILYHMASSIHCFMLSELTNPADICYNFRYVERNGRTTGNPWSLRQIGVYEKYDSLKDSSTWILISASETAREALDDIRLTDQPDDSRCLTETTMFHTVLIAAVSREWRKYLEHLQVELDILVSPHHSASYYYAIKTREG